MQRELNPVVAAIVIVIIAIVAGVFVWQHSQGDVVSGPGNPKHENRRLMDK
jgi:hypothetical protein